MKKKIVGIFVCMLMIAATTTIVSGKENMMPSVIDQQQPATPELYWLESGIENWQQFKNRGNILEKVELHIGCYFTGSSDITLSIKEDPAGSALTSITYHATDLPDNFQDWFTFDVPDVRLSFKKVYYICLRFDIGSEYAGSGSHNDPYPKGMSSHPDADWDFAFRTIVDKSKTKELYTPVLSAPEITGVRGGYGVIATVANAENLDWKIEIGGQNIWQGGITEGVVGSNGSATIRTPIFPPALGIGKINITVALYWSFIPVAWEERSAFMLGPFVLFVQ